MVIRNVGRFKLLGLWVVVMMIASLQQVALAEYLYRCGIHQSYGSNNPGFRCPVSGCPNGPTVAPAYTPPARDYAAEQAAAAAQRAEQERQQRLNAAREANARGISYYNSGDYNSAVSYFQDAANKSPDDPVIRQNLANAKAGLEAQRAQERYRAEQARIEAENRRRMQAGIDQLITELKSADGSPGIEVKSALTFKTASGAPPAWTPPPVLQPGSQPATPPTAATSGLTFKSTTTTGANVSPAGTAGPPASSTHDPNSPALRQLQFMSTTGQTADASGRRPATDPSANTPATPRPTVAVANSVEEARAANNQALAEWNAAMANPNLTAAERAAADKKYNEANAAYQKALVERAQAENK